MKSAIENQVTDSAAQRLVSLDILRGIDMMFLVALQPVVYRFLRAWGCEEGTAGWAVMQQLSHVPWEGFSLYDLIMPLFMFMSGITIPFSMAKYKTGRATVDRHFYGRVLKRFVVLWVVGMVVQGNLLALDPHQLKLFSNTLQSIAVGYVVVAFLYVFTSLKTQLWVVSACFLTFIAVFALFGEMDFAEGSNICERIDRFVLGHFQDGVSWREGQYIVSPTYHYTWILSSLNFIVTVYLGCLSGYILRTEATDLTKFKRLMGWGSLLVIIALAMSPFIPIIKHIWSSSMTLFAGGLCFLLMGLSFYLFDMRGLTRGFGWLRYFGMNSLVAYFLGEYVNFSSIIDSFCYGLRPIVGDYYGVIHALGVGVIIFLVLRWMHRHGYFIRA